MAKPPRGIVLATDASIPLESGFISKHQVLVVPRLFRLGHRLSLESDVTQVATSRARPLLEEAQVKDYIETYRQASGTTLVSIHPAAIFDSGAHEAILAQNMLEPDWVHVFSACTIQAGTRFLIETAVNFIVEQDPDLEQVLALLELVQRDMATYILTGNYTQLRLAKVPTLSQSISCLLGSRLLFKVQQSPSGKCGWEFDDLANLVNISQSGRQVIFQWPSRGQRYSQRLVTEMDRRFALDPVDIAEIYYKQNTFSVNYIGIVAVPNPIQINAHFDFIKRMRRSTR